MASHANLVFVLNTKNGYVDENGNFTSNIEEAKKIPFSQVGFSSLALDVYKRLGFDNTNITEKDIRLESVTSVHDSRLVAIERMYMELGNSYKEAKSLAVYAFSSFELGKYDNYLEFVDQLKKKVLEVYEQRGSDKEVEFDGKKVSLFKISEKIAEGRKWAEYHTSDGYDVEELEFTLKNPCVEKFFDLTDEEREQLNNYQNDGLVNYLKEVIEENAFVLGVNDEFSIVDSCIVDGKLKMYFRGSSYNFDNFLYESIRNYYYEKEMHITRMFGSYILLQKVDGELKAVKATPIPIKYCPLMIKLLKEVGGDAAMDIIETLKTEDTKKQEEAMCKLINEIVIKGGYFDTNRALNSCEANVLFGASETMSSAFKSHLIDAAVIVSNNLGTIITTNEFNTQGAVKRMTGLFYTSPSKEIMKTAYEEGIIPVFPYTAEIDQLEGVKKAIELGYKNIAVSVAAKDNYLHESLSELEKMHDVVIYKFGLCSTGIDHETAIKMREYSDVVWSCASKYVKEEIEPNAVAQVGVKIPVHIMTDQGWNIVSNHLSYMGADSLDDVKLVKGEEAPVLLNSDGEIKVLSKKNLRKCSDCPHPCI